MPIKKRSEDWEQWNVSPELKKRLRDSARQRRKNPTPNEKILYEALRDRRLDGTSFGANTIWGRSFWTSTARKNG